MELKEALRAALTSTKDEIAAAKKQQAELVERLDRLEIEQQGLELALARQEGTDAVVPNGWKHLTRIGAIERVLRYAGNPLGPTDITKRLISTGRDDRADLVSAGLAYMKRQGIVRSAGYGLWELTPDHQGEGIEGEVEDET